MIDNVKIIFSISIVLFFIPILAFLDKINLPQILLLDIYFILLFQTFLCIATIVLSLILHKLFLRKYFKFSIFIFCNSFIIYLLFFFNNLKSYIYSKQNFYLDEILVLGIYIILYFLIINFKKKKLDFLVRFVLIFIFLQIINFSLNLYSYQIKSTQNNEEIVKSNLTSFNTSLLKNNLYDENIFFIVLDGMMSLESAEKLKVIESKKNIIKRLEKNNMKYNENFFTNYDSTYLSIASLLQSSYPVTESSKSYKNRRNFFPSFILNQKKDNNFFRILRKTDRKFYWLGNWWASCQNNIYINCINSNQYDKSFSIAKFFYYDSVFSYILNFVSTSNETKSSIDFFKNPILTSSKNSIFLIHVMSPHPPYFFDKNCNMNLKSNSLNNINSKEIENYSYAYNCLIEIVEKWSSNKNNSMIFIFGDHGWSFNDKYMSNHEIDLHENKFKSFFSYKVPSRCEDIKKPNSIVNIFRFALICSGNNDLKYLKDLKFKTFYEDEKNYGKVILKN